MSDSASQITTAVVSIAATAAIHLVMRQFSTNPPAPAAPLKPVKVLVFDIDDTLYPVTNGFTNHRNNEVAIQYMVDRYGFTREAATKVRAHYFKKFHSTAKVSDQRQTTIRSERTLRTF